jgi:hypothetical protein
MDHLMPGIKTWPKNCFIQRRAQQHNIPLGVSLPPSYLGALKEEIILLLLSGKNSITRKRFLTITSCEVEIPQESRKTQFRAE